MSAHPVPPVPEQPRAVRCAGTGMARGPEMRPTASICERHLVFESRFMEIPALLNLKGKISCNKGMVAYSGCILAIIVIGLEGNA